MVTFAVSTSKNWDSADFSTRVGADLYNMSAGARLTIDTDTRWCANSNTMSGTLGQVGLNAAAYPVSGVCGEMYVDGSKVRIIPFTGGAGTVPAYNTTITDGTASSTFLGVWTSFSSAPLAVGAAMSGSGYIKVKNVTGGTYTSGSALIGITASCSGPDTVGWIDVVGVETNTIICYRNNKFTVRGEWFTHSTLVTTGLSGSTYQLPASLANTYYAGVWVDTGVSGAFEFYPSAGSLVAVNSVANDTVRGKVCWISSQGLVRFGYDGTNTNGYLPTVGHIIRVPNINFINTVAASGVNAVPNATLGTRMEFLTTNGGTIDIDKCNMAWYVNLLQPYSVTMTNTAILDAMTIQEVRQPISLTETHIGITTSGILNTVLFTGLPYGGTCTDCTWTQSSSGGGNVIQVSLIGCHNLNFVRCRSFSYGLRITTSNHMYTVVGSDYILWQDCVVGNGDIQLYYSNNLTINNLVWYDNTGVKTPTTQGINIFNIGQSCHDILIDGISFGGLLLCQPYGQIIQSVLSNVNNVIVQNVGTPSTPLNLGGTQVDGATWSHVTTTATVTASNHGLVAGDSLYVNISSDVAVITTALKAVLAAPTTDTFTFTCLNGAAPTGSLSYYPAVTSGFFNLVGVNLDWKNITARRCYLQHARVGCLPLMANDMGYINQYNVWGDTWNPALQPQRHGITRGIKAGPTFVAQINAYGNHWIDAFISELSLNKSAQLWTRSGTVATITSTTHNLKTADIIMVTVTSDPAAIPIGGLTGQYSVTVLTPNVFTMTCNDAGGTSGTITYENVSGVVGIQANEPDNDTTAQAVIDAGTPAWSGAGTITMYSVGDQVTWTMPDYVIGHTGFPNIFPLATITQANRDNFNWTYQIDKNDGMGYSGWKNAQYITTGDTTVGGFTVFNIPDTSELAVGDYVVRSNAPTFTFSPFAKIVSIDSPTQVTLDLANIQTTAGIPIVFRQYPNEVIDASKGFKLKFRCITRVANVVAQAFFTLRTTSTDASRALTYPDGGIVPRTTLWNPTIGSSVWLTPSGSSSLYRGNVIDSRFPVQDPVSASMSRYEYLVAYDDGIGDPTASPPWYRAWTTVANYVPVYSSASYVVTGALSASATITQWTTI